MVAAAAGGAPAPTAAAVSAATRRTLLVRTRMAFSCGKCPRPSDRRAQLQPAALVAPAALPVPPGAGRGTEDRSPPIAGVRCLRYVTGGAHPPPNGHPQEMKKGPPGPG